MRGRLDIHCHHSLATGGEVERHGTGAPDVKPGWPVHGAGSYLRVVERVTGIGGFFFRARNPQALAIWDQSR